MLHLLGAVNPFQIVTPSTGFQASDLVTRARFDVIGMIVVLGAGAWYLCARSRVRHSEGVWAAWRTGCFLAGLLVIAIATLSGLTTFDASSVTIHLINDTLMVMVAPILLTLGAPLTLAVRWAGPRGRDRIRSVVSSRAVRFLTSPVTGWILLGGGLALLYLTGLFQATVDHRSVGDAVRLGLLGVGMLFCWPAIAADPLPRPASFPQRMISALFALPYFLILGMSLESQNVPIARGLSISDFHQGSELMWSTGEFLGVAASIGLLVLWIRSEERSAVSRDETDDAEAEAQLAAWRANRAAVAMEEALARSTVVKARPGPGEG
ncbi:MAG: cytochrome c oxidase assembly protein [Actinomycetota bacterium]|nr:cytochrome c oxidase assembly protein [Actinomycetota bacterium]